MHIVPSRVCRVAGFAMALSAGGAAWAQQGQDPFSGSTAAGGARLVIPGPVVPATVPGVGPIQMETQTVWKPVCSNRVGMTALDLQAMALSHGADFGDMTKVIVVDADGGGNPRAGLDIVYVLGASVPAAAVPAFAAAEAYLESQFTADTMTVTVTVSFASLQSGVIGGTSSSYGYLTWADMRSTLQAGADASDGIMASLPAGTTIPVRYRTNRTTNEDRVFTTFANFKANGGTVAGNDASMQYSTNFPFDYDPSNGVTANTISLQDVVIHETGHALGCTSGLDFRASDIEVLDVFRFQRTDGNADYNPDTAAEFQIRPRMGVFNYNDDHNLDVIGPAEYRLSDGSPYQASHFREQVPAIGIMDPAFSYGETFYPNFLRTSDITLFDAIGYDK
ncbi:MAG: hypothetical protein GIKADHBN_02177 [Phycisphaerales bacterium]|nr:hypothetical protein [Phycisphaerales bacterium]